MATHIYGTMPTSIPEGFSKRVHFPNLANLNMVTGDHRRLEATGGSARGSAPWTIKTMPASAYGHEGAIPSGALFQVVIDEDNNLMSGDGFMLDDEWGLKSVYWISTGAQNKNSVDLADIKVRFVEDFETGEYWIDFHKWALGATTICATPAFADAHAEIVAAGASLIGDPMEALVCDFAEHEFRFDHQGEELVADMASRVPFERFYVPEAKVPHKIVVDDQRRVYGHLGLWESCHEGFEGQCLIIPRPRDAYASFNQPGVLTTRGMVQTGPIFTLGGHRPLKGKVTSEQEQAAYGGVENAWCDVRVIEGVHGPWLSGVVRPGVTDETIYAARASRISGHWKGNALKAIVSVNVAGFNVDGTASDDPLELDLAAGFAFNWNEEEGVSELVASFPPCAEPALPALASSTFTGTTTTTFNINSGLDENEIMQAIRRGMAAAGIKPIPLTDEEAAVKMGVSQDRRQAALKMALDDPD